MATVDPYRDRELFRFVGSMEGVPEWIDPAEGAGGSRALRRGYAGLELAARLAPGLVLVLGIAALANAARPWVTPLSPILLAIGVGLALRNALGLPPAYEPGVRMATGPVLRAGVALLGLHLGLPALAGLGGIAVPVIVASIAAALLLAAWMTRAWGLPRRLGILVAVGTAICGNTAIAAAAPVIGADEDETSYAVGTITLFGMLALFVHPFVAHAWFGDDARLAGLFLGTAIHDTAQVAGAGLLYAQHYGAPAGLDTATLTKFVRNLFMLAVIPLVALLYGGKGARRARASLRRTVPLFVVAFAALALVRTLGDRTLEHAAGWTAALGAASTLSTACLVVAMAGVGLSTRLGRLRSLGPKPLAAGLATALAVGLVSAAMVHLLARRLLAAV
jgi:uncharacterized integral membrane protein (TIGR00698 family)